MDQAGCRALLVAGLLFAVAAPAASTNSAWSFRAWESDDGLPNNNVTSLAQTADGYLWLATPSQLARFDGSQFEAFSQTLFGSGYQQRTTIIVGQADGGLWAPLDHGPVVRLNRGTVEVISNNLPNFVVETAIEDGEGALWISYRGGSLCRVKDGKVFNFSAKEGFPKGSGGCYLARDSRGRVWMAKSGRIAVFHDGRFETMLPVLNTTIRLAGARDGGLWICSGLDLLKYSTTGGLTKLGSLKTDEPRAMTTVLLEDDHGAVWVGTSTSGLFRYDGSGFELVPTSHRDISSLLEDHEGNLWVGTAGGGLDRIQPRTIELQGVESGLPFETVQSLCEDTEGTAWAVTQNGLVARRVNGVWSNIATNVDWRGELAECVTADRDGGVWVGGRSRLYYLRDGNLQQAVNGLTNHIIHALLYSSRGELWIGGEVLEKWHAGALTKVHTPDGVQLIRAMAEDNDGNIWMGTANGFLLRATGGEVFDETDRTLGMHDSIRCLTMASDGSLWVGFATSGLGRLKGGKFSRISTAQGLGDDSISQILPDGLGWLWLGADHGIFKVRQQELDAVADGKITHLQYIRYGRDQGLPSLQANFGFTPGALRTHDGHLWMPLRSALAFIAPPPLPDNLDPPPVLLKRVVVDDQTLGLYGGIMPVGNVLDLRQLSSAPRLPPGHHRLEFDFTALNFSTPENMQFRYRLAGVDDHWIDGKNQRSAGYPGLAAGRYQFEVTARKSGGEWNTDPAVFRFSIQPFFWETWWFRLAALSLFTAGVIAIGRYVSFRRLRRKLQSLEQQAALEKERARIAKDIHDDLGGSLTQTALLMNLVQQDRQSPERVDTHARHAASTIRQVMESVDEIVWAANPRNDTVTDLMDYISLFAVQFLQAANIRCRIDSPARIPNRPLSPEVRHSLFLVAKEALNNVVRHARATEVHLQVVATDELLRLNIVDDGRGFNGELRDDAYSDGLRNMRQRMTDLGGQFSVASRPEAGTTVSATYFWPAHK